MSEQRNQTCKRVVSAAICTAAFWALVYPIGSLVAIRLNIPPENPLVTYMLGVAATLTMLTIQYVIISIIILNAPYSCNIETWWKVVYLSGMAGIFGVTSYGVGVLVFQVTPILTVLCGGMTVLTLVMLITYIITIPIFTHDDLRQYELVQSV